MALAWVAGSVRARLLTSRRVGRDGARELAWSASLDEALQALALSPYGREVSARMSLEAAQHAVAAVVLWHLRVLAGWLPPAADRPLRALAAWFELANVQDRLAYFKGEPRRPHFELGGLGTAWSRLARTTSAEQVREVLAASRWGDPGSADPGALLDAMRAAWAQWVVVAAPEAAGWARAALVLWLARALFASARRPAALGRLAALARLERGWDLAGGPAELAALLPRDLGWPLEGVEGAVDLWLAEARWWARVEREGARMTAGRDPGRPVVVGVAALLGADAWRVRAALAAAARGGAAREAFDAVA